MPPHVSPPQLSPSVVGQPMSRSAKLTLIAGLYSTQNLCLAAYNFTFLIAAQNAGLPLKVIGAASGIAMILVLKFLWAPLVDRFGSQRFGHYRSWLIICQSALVLGALILATLDPGRDFGLVIAVFAAMFLFAGTQDVATDATTTRLLSPTERGIGNGIQSAGSSFAMVMGGGLLLVISGSFGWSAAMLVLAALSAVPLAMVIRWPERETTGHLATPRASLKSIWQFFRSPGVTLWACVIMPIYVLGGTVAYNLLRPMLTAAGWSEQRLGMIVVIGGGLAGIMGGVAGGLTLAKVGCRRGLVVLGLAQLLGAMATIWLAWTPESSGVAALVTVLSSAGFSAATAVIYTIAMDLTRLESSGTDFTAFSTIAGIVMVIAAGGGVALADAVGFFAVAITAAGLAAVGLVVTIATVQPVLEQAAANTSLNQTAE